MEKSYESSKIVTLTSLVLSALSAISVFIQPENTLQVVIACSIVLVFVIAIEKFKQIDNLQIKIDEINRKLNIENRFNIIEKEMAEQKGRLAVFMNKKAQTTQTIMIIWAIILFFVFLYIAFGHLLSRP